MIIQVLSDLHLEFFKDKESINEFLLSLRSNVDYIILAGDNFTYNKIGIQMECVFNIFGSNVIFIPGNHEYYHTNFEYMDNLLTDYSNRYGMIFLNNSYFIKDDIIFIGACGWHDVYDKTDAKYLNDFHIISDLRFDPYKAVGMNRISRKFFDDTMNEFKGKTMVCITHNSPLVDHTPTKYMGGNLNKFFVNDWSDLITTYNPKLWISGHNHQYKEFDKLGTHFIENGYGYNKVGEIKDFKPKLEFVLH